MALLGSEEVGLGAGDSAMASSQFNDPWRAAVKRKSLHAKSSTSVSNDSHNERAIRGRRA